MKMKLFFLSSVFCISFLNGFGAFAAKPEDQILGIWWAPKKDGRIEIVKNGDLFEGRIIWSVPEKADRLDSQNPDKNLRSKKLLGMKFLTDFKFDGEKWVGGKIYDPDNGQTYSCILSLKESKLYVRGYVGVALFGRTEVFERYTQDFQ